MAKAPQTTMHSVRSTIRISRFSAPEEKAMRVLTDDELKIVRSLLLQSRPFLTFTQLFTKLASYIGRNVSLLLERTDEVSAPLVEAALFSRSSGSRLSFASTR
jgi:hypothetical protein